MADDADRAADLQAATNTAAAAVRRPESAIKPVGWCHACGEDLGPEQLFCGTECADEHERMERQRRKHG